MTNVKKTTPNTFVAFCSSRMMRPWRDEFRDMTLEFREWCERMVAPRVIRHGVDLFATVESAVPLAFMPLMRLWLRSVAERRSGDAIVGTLFGVSNNVVLCPPKLEPRRDRWLRRVSHVTTEFVLLCADVEKLIFRIGMGFGDGAGAVIADLCSGDDGVRWSDGVEQPFFVDRIDGKSLGIVLDTDFTNGLLDWLFVEINGTISQPLVAIILTLVDAFNVLFVREPKYGQVHGGGNTISFGFVLCDGCTCAQNTFLCFSSEFCRFFSFLQPSSSSTPSAARPLPPPPPSRSATLTCVAAACSKSSAIDSSNPSSFWSMRDKLLNRFRKPVPNFCDSVRANDVHADVDARRFLYRRGESGL